MEKGTWRKTTPPHLKPLSVYSRMITSETNSTLHQTEEFSNPFINFKIEVVGTCQKKRKLDDALSDHDYVTLAKKHCSPGALTSGRGCVFDICSLRQDSLSTLSKPAVLDGTDAVCIEMKKTVSSQLNAKHAECETAVEPERNKVMVPTSVECGKVSLIPVPDFDTDVNSMLCLEPEGSSDSVESCKIAVVNALSTIKDEEEDKGYVSLSYMRDLELKKSLSLSESHQGLSATSSPLFRNNVVNTYEVKRQFIISPDPASPQKATKSEDAFSFATSDLCPIVSGPQLESENCLSENLEDDGAEEWNIGPPRFESSICQKESVEIVTGGETVSVKAEGDVIEPVHDSQTSLRIEETTLDTSYEITVLPPVKVKSVVVLAHQPTSNSKQASRPELNSASCIQSNSSKSSVLVSWNLRDVNLEREKRQYVQSVTKHMNEKQHTDPDVVTELQNLMSHVSDRTPGSNGKHWQHPSDLTQRNYQRRFGNMVPQMSLSEWQAKSSLTHKRFNKVPKTFERSPIP